MSRVPFRPSKAELLAARGKKVADLIAPGLKVLFCGINPGLYSGAVGHHFARPGNRFWPALHRSGFTPRQLSPFEEQELLQFRLGVTNLVARATAAAAELSAEELSAGAKALARKVGRCRPGTVAFLGLTAYRTAFSRPGAKLGEQDEAMGESRIWLLPNPSGLNAHHQISDLARMFAQLREAAG